MTLKNNSNQKRKTTKRKKSLKSLEELRGNASKLGLQHENNVELHFILKSTWYVLRFCFSVPQEVISARLGAR